MPTRISEHVVEFEDSEAHGAETVAAVRFEPAPVEQIWHAKLEAQGEGCGEE